MMFSCREVGSLLGRFVRGAVPACDFFEIRCHVVGCPACAGKLREAREAMRLARSGCQVVADPVLDDVPDLLVSDIVLVSQCASST